ncbi:hypothetical protein HanRHA438_Chr10g0472881 [Helianthus annuus]|nr:hypothetical protein HanRHA438_Chr10g0472881 [Helianthus annuus]
MMILVDENKNTRIKLNLLNIQLSYKRVLHWFYTLFDTNLQVTPISSKVWIDPPHLLNHQPPISESPPSPKIPKTRSIIFHIPQIYLIHIPKNFLI